MLREDQGRDSGHLYAGQKSIRHRGYADLTFEVELTERVESRRNSPVCADSVERSMDGIKAVPDGIILDDLQSRLVCH